MKTTRLVVVLAACLATWACLPQKAVAQPPQAGAQETAFAEERRKAEQGDAGAQFNIGLSYRIGFGLQKDDVEAAKWLRKAAEQGFAAAQWHLGLMHHYGEGVPKDDGEAVKWHRKAAEQGNAQAQFSLGVAYHEGNGVHLAGDDGRHLAVRPFFDPDHPRDCLGGRSPNGDAQNALDGRIERIIVHGMDFGTPATDDQHLAGIHRLASRTESNCLSLGNKIIPVAGPRRVTVAHWPPSLFGPAERGLGDGESKVPPAPFAGDQPATHVLTSLTPSLECPCGTSASRVAVPLQRKQRRHVTISLSHAAPP